ncbi:SpoIIE family protein phosphatase [bacterium]|nr:SpoIIE family protein phosphatase [bacterium]
MSDQLTNASLPFSTIDLNARQPVVVAEGDARLRQRYASVFRQAGMDVHGVERGEAALEMAVKRRAGLVLCGGNLNDLNGSALCRRLAEMAELSQTYLIQMIPSDQPEAAQDAQEAGVDECLPSGCSDRELLSAARAGLRISSLQKGIAIRNRQFQDLMQRLNREMETVALIQKALLPQAIPRTHAYDFTAFYMPSTECGGDYYDLISLDDKRQGFVIADVSGHGAPAMVTMALVRQNFHLIAQQFEQPHLLLEEMNRLLFDHLPTDQYVTMHYAIIDSESLRFTYASAGHNPPFWFQARTHQAGPLQKCEAFPLKLVMREAKYESVSIQLEAGDRMVFYTDGFPECFGPRRQTYGLERFESTINRHAPGLPVGQLETTIVTDVLSFADGQPIEDDLTLAIIGVH